MVDLAELSRLSPTELRDLQAHAEAAAIVQAYELAQAGDPFPLIELQWGKIIPAAEVLRDRDVLRQHKRYLILDEFQMDAFRSLFDPTITGVFIKGNTGCGKTLVLGIGICIYYLAWQDARIVVTRDSYRPAVSKTFSEVAAWWQRMAYKPRGIELQRAAIIDSADPQHVVTVASPDSAEGFSGTHGLHVMFAFDEASAPVLNSRFDMANTQATKLLSTANPRTQSGKFWEAFQSAEDPDATQTISTSHGRRRLITVDGDDILNVRARCLEVPVAPPGGVTVRGREYRHGETLPPADFATLRAIIPGQTCYDKHLSICAHPDPDWVACMGHGRFPGDDKERQVILGRWLAGPAALWRRYHELRQRIKSAGGAESRVLWQRYFPVQAFGLDVGGSTQGDPSVLTVGGDRGIYQQHAERIADAVAVCDWVERVAREEYSVLLREGNHPVCVDTDGLGWGIVGILRSRGVHVVEFRGNDPSDVDPKRYSNKRAEAYGELGERLNDEGRWKGVPLMLPDDPTLLQELKAPKKVFANDGLKWGITPKRRVPGVKRQHETIMDMIGRSPDRGDSAAYWYRALQVRPLSLETLLDDGFF